MENETDLTKIPGFGKKMAQRLIDIGYPDIDSLKGQNPEEIFEKDCINHSEKVCSCVLYCYRLAVAYADGTINNPEKLKWHNWKD